MDTCSLNGLKRGTLLLLNERRTFLQVARFDLLLLVIKVAATVV
jgi:hypothetical protein